MSTWTGNYGCGTDTFAIYTNVVKFIDWIVSVYQQEYIGINTVSSKPETETEQKVMIIEKCGKSIVSPSQSADKTRTRSGQWPFLAALSHAESLRYFCGGSLISTRHVVTGTKFFGFQ